MYDTIKSMNKTMTDWQVSQIRLAGKQAQSTLTNTMSAWEHTVETMGSLQQDMLNTDVTKTATKK
jgi:hypothetical protein